MKKVAEIIILVIILFALVIASYLYFENQFIVRGQTDESDSEYSYFQEPYDVATDIHGEITVALYNSGYLYNQETDSGINNDILAEISERMGISFDKKIVPRARIYSMFEDGSLPMSVSTVETPKRSQSTWFIPYFSQKNDVLMKSDLQIFSENDLLKNTGIRVGIIRGYYYGRHYNDLIKKLKERDMVVEAKDTEALFQMLKDDWIQVTFNLPASYLYYFEVLKIDDIIILDWAPEEETLTRCISLSKKYFSWQDTQLFRTTIDDMKNDGTLFKIYSRYLPKNVAERMCDF